MAKQNNAVRTVVHYVNNFDGEARAKRTANKLAGDAFDSLIGYERIGGKKVMTDRSVLGALSGALSFWAQTEDSETETETETPATADRD